MKRGRLVLGWTAAALLFLGFVACALASVFASEQGRRSPFSVFMGRSR
jgi:hypothetical protein